MANQRLETFICPDCGKLVRAERILEHVDDECIPGVPDGFDTGVVIDFAYEELLRRFTAARAARKLRKDRA